MKTININTQHSHFIGCWNLENNELCEKFYTYSLLPW